MNDASAARPVLSLTNVHGYIGQSHLLHGISLEVPANAVTVLLGRNGVGKTSTLRAIMGLIDRVGSIELDGTDLTGMATHQIALRGVGYVPENRDVFHGLTVTENLRLAERPGQEPDYDRVYELFPELKQRGRQLAGSLSGGQQQMVSVARALLNRNRLLLIDEPTKGLAPRLVSEVVGVLERTTQEVAVLLVEQNLAAARRLADHAIVIDQGMVAASGTGAEIFGAEERLRSMLGVGSADPAHPRESAEEANR